MFSVFFKDLDLKEEKKNCVFCVSKNDDFELSCLKLFQIGLDS